MYFQDLTVYSYYEDLQLPGVLNVGWLESGRPFPKGPVAVPLVMKLIDAARRYHTQATRGWHACDLCKGERVFVESGAGRIPLGSTEIWIRSNSGTVYASPDLIIHYIDAHGYQPPAEYRAALADYVIEGDWNPELASSDLIADAAARRNRERVFSGGKGAS